jgi:hypothetical protein
MCEEDQIKQSDLRLFAMAYNNQKALWFMEAISQLHNKAKKNPSLTSKILERSGERRLLEHQRKKKQLQNEDSNLFSWDDSQMSTNR